MRNSGKARINYERQMRERDQRNRSTDNIIVDPLCDPRHAQHAGLINQALPITDTSVIKDKSYPHSSLPSVPRAHRHFT